MTEPVDYDEQYKAYRQRLGLGPQVPEPPDPQDAEYAPYYDQLFPNPWKDTNR